MRSQDNHVRARGGNRTTDEILSGIRARREVRSRSAGQRQPSVSAEKESGVHAVFADVKDQDKIDKSYYESIVRVISHDTEFDYDYPFKIKGDSESSGTGFFIDRDGHILTCSHVVEDASHVFVEIPTQGKKQYKARILGVCPFFDLAVIKVIDYSNTAFCPLYNERNGKGGEEWVKSGDETYALGFPLGQDNLKVTKGIISGQQFKMYQIDVPINPGNSGGPLIKDNKVVGVNGAGIMMSNNIGYAVPIACFYLIREQLFKSKSSSQGSLVHYPEVFGFEYQRSSVDFKDYFGHQCKGGVFVKKVFKGSPVSSTKLKKGDILCSMNDVEIDQYGEFEKRWMNQKMTFDNMLATMPLGKDVKISYWNGSKNVVETFPLQQYSMPIRTRYPVFEKIHFAVVAGVVVMPLSRNHLTGFGVYGRIRKYKRTENQHEFRLVIPTILSGSYMATLKIIKPNEIIDRVNDIKTRTMDEFRQNILHVQKKKYITILTEEKNLVILPVDTILSEEKHLQDVYKYPEDAIVAQLRETLKGRRSSGDRGSTQRRRSSGDRGSTQRRRKSATARSATSSGGGSRRRTPSRRTSRLRNH